MDIQKILRLLRNHRRTLTRQQIKTIRGQALAGDVEGAIKGLSKILKGRYA